MPLLLVGTPASPQSARLESIQLCNGADRTSSKSQIKGCTTLIESGSEPLRILAVAYNNRGNAYVGMGDFDRAVLDYDRALKIDGKYAKAFNNRGVAFGKGGQHDRAVQDLDVAISLNPNYANAFANRAETYLSKGNYDRALQDYDAAIRLEPTLDAWNGRCRTRFNIDELQGAIADCSEALRLDANSAVTLELLGLAHLRMRQWDLAIANFDAALERNPGLASSLFGRGVAQKRRGRVDQGNVDIAAASAIAPNIGEEFVRYGVE